MEWFYFSSKDKRSWIIRPSFLYNELIHGHHSFTILHTICEKFWQVFVFWLENLHSLSRRPGRFLRAEEPWGSRLFIILSNQKSSMILEKKVDSKITKIKQVLISNLLSCCMKKCSSAKICSLFDYSSKALYSSIFVISITVTVNQKSSFESERDNSWLTCLIPVWVSLLQIENLLVIDRLPYQILTHKRRVRYIEYVLPVF